MGRPKKDTKVIRFVVPVDVYRRFERVASAMGMELGLSTRVLASLQLAQLEATHVFPDIRETEVQREDRATKALSTLLPSELAARLAEPEPEPKPFGFGGGRAELDEEVVEVLPVVIKREYVGYMAGL